ncbi:MAG: GFA family protein [Gammaproteobacteria bacterium]|jgi:hypothetical protein|nr:GFA family protein [Gammaproteobacteria bacterium]
MAKITKGHCLCGQTTFAFAGEPVWVAHCHCDSCRRNCSAPFTTFIGVPRAMAEMKGWYLRAYQSSAGVKRWFCRHCGSPVAYDAKVDDNLHFYLSALEDPQQYQPNAHVFTAEQLSWVHLDDKLPKHAQGSTPDAIDGLSELD